MTTGVQVSLLTPGRAARPAGGTLKDRVLVALSKEALTDDELIRKLRAAGNSVRPRRLELLHAGLIECVGRRKPPGKRTMCKVYAGGAALAAVRDSMDGTITQEARRG